MQRPGFLGEETYIKKKENKRPPETPIPYLTLDKILLRLIEGIIVVSISYHHYFSLSQPLRLVFF